MGFDCVGLTLYALLCSIGLDCLVEFDLVFAFDDDWIGIAMIAFWRGPSLPTRFQLTPTVHDA